VHLPAPSIITAVLFFFLYLYTHPDMGHEQHEVFDLLFRAILPLLYSCVFNAIFSSSIFSRDAKNFLVFTFFSSCSTPKISNLQIVSLIKLGGNQLRLSLSCRVAPETQSSH
jgi:hypothetical protein